MAHHYNQARFTSENRRRNSMAGATKVEHLREDFGLTSETTDDETNGGADNLIGGKSGR